MSLLINNNIKLLVCDMAGTTINEGGIIYKAIQTTLTNLGFSINNNETKNWYGRDKNEVIQSYITANSDKNNSFLIKQAEKDLIKCLEEKYFDNNNVRLVDKDLLTFFNKLRHNNIKVALNTGYPMKLQSKIIDHLGMKESIDAYISSEQVKQGRPHPYMIYKLATDLNIHNTQHIAKIGDTIPDMLEGLNANCGLTIGVLSGAENFNSLFPYSNTVTDNIMNLDDL
jgi:phosphonatase-like hydrolase